MFKRCAGPLSESVNIQLLTTEQIADTVAELSLVDEERLDGVCLRDAPKSPEPFVFYYVKLELPSGQMAWSSPVWLTL